MSNSSDSMDPPVKPVRLVLLFDEPKFPSSKLLLRDLRELPENVLVKEFNEIDKFQQETISSKPKFDHINISIDYTDKFINDLKKNIGLLKSCSKLFQDAGDISYHVSFQPFEDYGLYTKKTRGQYNYFKVFNEALKDVAGEKIVNCSIDSKYDFDDVKYPEENRDPAWLHDEIQSDIQNWTKLKVLEYRGSSFREFPNVKLPDTLEILNIGGGNILQWLVGFKMPPRLKVLLANDGAMPYTNNVKFPNTLETLELEGNKIYFVDEIDFPKSLQHLNLSSNRIDDLSDCGFPKNLKSLDVSANPIEIIEDTKFPSGLKELDISNLPNESMTGVKFPASLERLNLQCSMSSSEGLKLPRKLKALVLSDNQITNINSLKLPNSLEELNISNNNIKTLSKVKFPSKLRELYMGTNLITTLKDAVFPPSLEVLDINNGGYTRNDRQITSLKDANFPPNLKVLNLGYQGIKSIENFDFPQSLEYLSLKNSKLESISDVRFGNSLITLDLSGTSKLQTLNDLIIPETVTELGVPSHLKPTLPSYIIDRVNAGKLSIIDLAEENEYM